MTKESEHKTFNIDEICSLSGMNKRTVRYYIQHGLVSRPEGTGKGAWYTREHLQQLLAIAKWKEAGLSLERIRELVTGGDGTQPVPPPKPKQPGSVEVWSHVYLADGLELQIEPNRSGLSPEQLRTLAKAVMHAYSKIKEEVK